MILVIESTDDVVLIDGVEHRIWSGTTKRGVSCLLLVRRIAVHVDDDASEFESDRHLAERPPENPQSIRSEIPF